MGHSMDEFFLFPMGGTYFPLLSIYLAQCRVLFVVVDRVRIMRTVGIIDSIGRSGRGCSYA